MWIIIVLIFGPFIYYIVSIVVDSVSDTVNGIRRKKCYGEEKLVFLDTYKNDNISKEDTMFFLNSQINTYRQQYYNIDYKIFDSKNEQNYAWSVKTTKKTFGWGVIYNILFHFSNGWIYLSFSNKNFNSGGVKSLPYYFGDCDFGTVVIENTLAACRNEAKIIWKANGYKPTEYLPFNFVPLSENTPKDNASQPDLLNFYRNLLGLKLSFTHDELKKSYREAVAKYHPDRYGASSPRDRENAEMLMKQVNEAYEKLKNSAQ